MRLLFRSFGRSGPRRERYYRESALIASSLSFLKSPDYGRHRAGCLPLGRRVIEEVGVSSRQVGYLDIKTIGEEHRMIDAEKIVRDFCAAWGEGKVEKPDPDTIAGYFATEGEWHLWVPGQVVQGREAIRAEIERQREFSTFMECGIEIGRAQI